MSASRLSGQMDWEAIGRSSPPLFEHRAMTVAAARLGIIGTADAQSTQTQPAGVPAIKPGISRTLVRVRLPAHSASTATRRKILQTTAVKKP